MYEVAFSKVLPNYFDYFHSKRSKKSKDKETRGPLVIVKKPL